MKHSRRKMLSFGLWGSISAFIGWKGAKTVKESIPMKKVKMITADGKVVEVEEKYLPKKEKSRPVTNEQLKSWMTPGNK